MMTQAASSRIYRFQQKISPSSSAETETPHAVVQCYTLRGLTLEEVEEWTRFCASVFATKRPSPPPASYFARHFHNDPDHDASLIRVAMIEGGGGGDDNDDDDDGKNSTRHPTMVASCRVFRRTISAGSSSSGTSSFFAGGIGEVCTSAPHRRRGIAGELLHDAMGVARAETCTVSLLHAAPAFVAVYAKAGFHQSVSRWNQITIHVQKLLPVGAATAIGTVRMASFPTDTKEMMAIHQLFSEQRFAGCIIRSEEYWNKYISKELEGSLFVREDKGTEIEGWICLLYTSPSPRDLSTSRMPSSA